MHDPSFIKHMFRVLKVGSFLHVDMPWPRDNAEFLFKELDLHPVPLAFEIKHGGKSVASGRLDTDWQIQIDLSGKPSGVYEVRITGRTTDEQEKEVWRQYVYVQTSCKRTPTEIHQLAQRYAPIFLFSRKEEYFPVSLEDLVASKAVRESKGHVSVDTIFGEQEVPVSRLDEFLRFNGHADYLLDQSMAGMDESVFFEIRGDFRRSVVYYSYIEDRAKDRFFINYHTFYAFDPKTGIAKFLNVGPHIFDRESLTVVFRGDGTPESIVLSGHLENQAILFLEKLRMWNTGRVRLRFGDPLSPEVRGHAIVPVAEGSHALYPTAGLYHISVLTELAGHVFRNILPLDKHDADEPPEMSSHQVLLPPTLQSETFANYELRPLRLDMLHSDPSTPQEFYDPSIACLVFSGYWVDVPGFHNERFPPFSRKEMDIEDWVDQAYVWEWEGLPPRVTDHNRALGDYIQGKLRK